MARKDCSKCGDATCNCAIIEGPGTNVTGIGSGASPYIVEADIVHVDTPTVTLTGNGGSTPLSAVVNPCGLTDNLNEVSSGSLLVKGTTPDCLGTLSPGLPGEVLTSDGVNASWEAPAGGAQTPITPVDTPSVNLTVSGVDNHTLQADVIISPDLGNTLVENANGLFAAGGAITVLDTPCIDLEGVGTVADPLTADLILDPAGNLECTAAGLRVEPSPNVGDVLTTSAVGVVTWEPGGGGGAQTPLTVVDTNCINLTASGVDNHTLQADPIIDPDPCNVLTCEPTGLMVTLPGPEIVNSTVVANVVLPPTGGTLTNTSGVVVLTNPSVCRTMVVHYNSLFNVTMTLGAGNAMNTQYTFETSINGGAFAVEALDRMGVNGVGIGGVANIDNVNNGAGVIRQVTLAPGANITFQARATAQVLGALANGITMIAAISIRARGFYV